MFYDKKQHARAKRVRTARDQDNTARPVNSVKNLQRRINRAGKAGTWVSILGMPDSFIEEGDICLGSAQDVLFGSAITQMGGDQ